MSAAVCIVACALWGLAYVVPCENRRTRMRSTRHGAVREKHAQRRRITTLAGRRRKNAARAGAMGEILAEVSTLVRSGSPVNQAWQRAAERAGVDPHIEPDGIPRMMGEAATARQRKPLLRSARAAWIVSQELGSRLADTLDECSIALIHADENEAACAIALAGPVASAKLLAALPLGGIALGSLAVGSLTTALFGGGIASLSAVAGVVFYSCGVWWTSRLVRIARNAESRGGGIDPVVHLSLLGSALRSGASIPRSLIVVGEAADDEDSARAGRLLLLGASWDEAWRSREHELLPGSASLMRRALEPAWNDGADPLPLLERAGSGWLARRDRRAREAAERLGVRLAMPLGLCFLPAFVLVGIVPIIATTASGVSLWG